MKLLGYILIAVSICLGTFAAATAYSPKIERARELIQTKNARFTLAQPAGVLPVEGTGAPPPHGRQPVLPRETNGQATLLTLEGIAALERANGQLADPNDRALRIRIKQFSFATWDLAWLFGVAVFGLIAGGVMVKLQTRREIAAHAASVEETSGSPQGAMRAIAGELRQARARAGAAATRGERLDGILHSLGEVQQTHIQTVVQSRTVLVGRLGLGGYAQFMDRFSALERQINRAWSAAADGHEPEALASLDRALDLVPDASAALGS